jgi:flavin reductase (DIM6/NTAB) family NADH-FMN oxidoreductase RutF
MKLAPQQIVYSTPPSPVVLVSTINKKGRKNIAPFGFFMPCSHKPPMVAIGVRKTTHTYKYAKEIGEFVVGIPTPRIAKQLYKASEVGKTDDEFKECGLTPVPSKKVRPFRIKECQVNLECKFVSEIDTGDHTMIIGEVIEAECDGDIFDKNKAKLRYNLDSLYHVTGPRFITKDGRKIILRIK